MSRGHGMSPREASVMDIWDGGGTIEQIVEQTGITEKYARHVVSHYQLSGHEDRTRAAAMRTASARYAAAVAATGRVYQ